MSWEKVKLGDLYEVHNGLSKGGKFFGSGYPFLSFSTVFNNWFIPQNIKDLVRSTDKEQESYSIKKGDVFITRTSETADELGMSCVALKDYPQATYNGFCKRLRPIKSSYEVNPRYIGYYLRTSDFRGKFLGLSGTMTTRASLRNEDLLAMEILLPPIKEQKRIADILSAYDNLIENNQKQIKLLEEAAGRLYKQWFIDLRYPGHETIKIVDGLPKGWKRCRMDEKFKTVLGGTPSRANPNYWNGKVAWINSGEVNNLRIMKASECITELALEKSATKMMPVHTTVLAITGATLGQVSYTEIETCANQSVVGIIDETELFSMYLYLFVSTNIKSMIGKATGGAQQHINKDIVNEYKIILPEERVIKKMNILASPLFNKIADCYRQIDKLTESRDRLLPKLMNGEIEA